MVRLRLGGMALASDGRREPPSVLAVGGGRHRRAVDRVIPRRVARQQSPPPFHPAELKYLEGKWRARGKCSRVQACSIAVMTAG
jgi:hypothetical protein